MSVNDIICTAWFNNFVKVSLFVKSSQFYHNKVVYVNKCEKSNMFYIISARPPMVFVDVVFISINRVCYVSIIVAGASERKWRLPREWQDHTNEWVYIEARTTKFIFVYRVKLLVMWQRWHKRDTMQSYR